MELGEAEVLGVVDDDGVDVWHVDAALDDGGRKEYVVVVVGEVEYGFFELLGWHLAVACDDSGVGHKATDGVFDIA